MAGGLCNREVKLAPGIVINLRVRGQARETFSFLSASRRLTELIKVVLPGKKFWLFIPIFSFEAASLFRSKTPQLAATEEEEEAVEAEDH